MSWKGCDWPGRAKGDGSVGEPLVRSRCAGDDDDGHQAVESAPIRLLACSGLDDGLEAERNGSMMGWQCEVGASCWLLELPFLYTINRNALIAEYSSNRCNSFHLISCKEAKSSSPVTTHDVTLFDVSMVESVTLITSFLNMCH